MKPIGTSFLFFALLSSACFEEPMGADSSSSSDGTSANDEDTAADETGDTDPTEDPSADTSGGESSSDEGEDAGSDESSSTGEALTDFALAFDGSSHARKTEDDGHYGWIDDDFTVEAWIAIDDTDATGVIFDAQNGFDVGWVLYVHPDWHALVFSFFDESHVNQIVIGPSVEEIGVGWHHVAATKSGGGAFLHVDGVTVAAQDVSDQVALMNVTLSVGAVSTGEASLNLRSASVDDIRVTASPLYSGSFDPPVVLDAEVEGALLLLRFDEGDGVVAQDDVSGMTFTLNSPSWVPGHE